MKISAFCIRRPVFTTLLMAALLVAGLLGYDNLPVSALPNVDFPTIQVTANLPGASPETMASTVATPLEKQFSSIAGISTMTSSSILGTTRITIQFDLARQLDGAALDVQTAISTAMRSLPKEMTTPPYFRKVNPADQAVLLMAIWSDTLPLSKVDEYADTIMAQRISMVPGVAQTNIYGEKKYAVRIQADPNKLAAQGLGLNEVGQAVTDAATNAPLGSLYGPERLYNIDIDGQPRDAAGFRELIATWRNGAPVKLGDIAEVVDDVADTHQAAFLNGKPAIILAIQRQPGANTIDVVDRVRELIPSFRSQIPASIEILPTMDRSVSIRNSVHDVQFTLLLTFALVVGVIFVFLHNGRATLIPSLAVPLSVIATFGAMNLMGFSLDNISLFALTLCVGFVVDDAIVMLENIVRHIENGKKPKQAAFDGAREVGFTILSMTLSLVAVFIPVLFMGGIVGRLFREFALTISVAILFSGFIALTLTPMLCALWLKDQDAHQKSVLGQVLEKILSRILGGYERSLRVALAHRRFVLLLTFLLLGASVAGFSFVSKGFFPTEDTGFISATTEAAQDISYDAMLAKQKAVAAQVQANPNVATVFSSLGGGRNALNAGNMLIGLKEGDREDISTVLQQLRASVSVAGIKLFMQPIQNIQVGGRAAKSQYQYTLQSTDLPTLYARSEQLRERLASDKNFQDVASDLQLKNPKALLTIDQHAASREGITYADIRKALYNAYGAAQVGSIYTANDDYQVILEVGPAFQRAVEDLNLLYVSGASGKAVPLNAIAHVTRGLGALSVNHQGQLPAVTLSFNLPPAVSLGQAVERLEQVKTELHFPASLTGQFQGTAQVFQDSLAGQGALLGLAILAIYIILGMLYESFIHPVTILSGLPSAGLGAILVLMLFKMDLSVISIIGIVLLIGIVKKNAIMMIDFAVAARKTGASAEDAIFQACLLRFRPIMMTTMAALFGTLPVAFAFGAGAELRQPLGVAVVGGLCLSQLLTLYITPVVYLYLERLSGAVKKPVKTAASEE